MRKFFREDGINGFSYADPVLSFREENAHFPKPALPEAYDPTIATPTTISSTPRTRFRLHEVVRLGGLCTATACGKTYALETSRFESGYGRK